MDWLDRVFCGDSRHVLRQIPDESVHLTVTSPPYNLGIEYPSYADNLPHDEYMAMLADIWREVWRVSVPGARVCVNVANVGRKPYSARARQLAAQLEMLGWYPRGEIIWDKQNAMGHSSTAWGTWLSPADPCLRDEHEYILVFQKGGSGLQHSGPGDIIKDEFLAWTRSAWRFKPVNAGNRQMNPCPVPFPTDLPMRLIKLYTYPGMTVLDPFMGGGTTPIAARTYGRHFVGADLDPASCRYAAFALGCDVVDLREVPHAD